MRIKLGHNLHKIVINNRKAATMVEYVLVISLVSLGAIAAILAFKSGSVNLFGGIQNNLLPVDSVLSQSGLQ